MNAASNNDGRSLAEADAKPVFSMSELKKLILIASAAEGGVTKPQIRMFIKSCTRMRSNAMILQSFLRGEIILSRFVKGDF